MNQQMGNTDRTDINFGIEVIWSTKTKLWLEVIGKMQVAKYRQRIDQNNYYYCPILWLYIL